MRPGKPVNGVLYIKSGQVVIKPHYKRVHWFEKGLVEVFTEDWWDYIDKTGKVIWKSYEKKY